MTEKQIIAFNYDEFILAYTEFNTLSEPVLQNYFDVATGILSPVVGEVVCDANKLKNMLYLLTAHIGFLFNRGAGTVGALSSATEGSVSASFSQILQNINASWFNQTQYGALFWQLARPYMLGRYYSYGCKC